MLFLEIMKVALVHDYLNQTGGAESVLRWLHHLFPNAPVFTLIYDPKLVPPDFRGWEIHPVGWSKYMPFKRKLYKYYLLAYPSMIEQIDLSQFDLVISSSYLWAKGVVTRSDTLHICYCHTPMRQAWDLYFDYKRSYSKLVGKLLYPFVFNYIRLWDKVSADRVDRFIANSETVRRRIAKIYRRDAVVIYPPVELINYVKPSFEKDDYYLFLSRLVPYKRADIAVKAFSRLGKKLVVAGVGPQMKYLRKIASSNIKFIGAVDDVDKATLLAGAKALIYPAEEDFGIVPVEAQAAGTPVIAYRKGGVSETVVDGVTGILFEQQTVESLCDAVVLAEQTRFDLMQAVQNAQKFSVDNFLRRVTEAVCLFVTEFWGEKEALKLFSLKKA